jgi:hypothetical protein
VQPIFAFSTEVVPLILEEIKSADRYVRIAMFQIHHEDVFKTLKNLLTRKVKVEILTLPYDSINEEIRSPVENRFEDLARNGAILYFNKWNVGNPEQTRTAVGRWYSFHGKFIVTDKSAIALSANFTHSKELDAAIIYKGAQDKISEFNTKFDELLQLFVTKDNHHDGSIRRRILNITPTNG